MQALSSRSRLVRLLGEWTPVDGEPAGADFAERLSLWVNAFDAVALQSSHQAIRAMGAASGRTLGPRRLRPERVAAGLQRLRAELAAAIAQELQADAGPAAFQQRQHALQRQMQQAIAALRDEVRQVLAGVSVRLRQLAALDAALEQVIAPREQAVLHGVPALLERRWQQCAQSDDGDTARFRQDWREALLAELDLRLEPVAGLVEALTNELKNLP